MGSGRGGSLVSCTGGENDIGPADGSDVPRDASTVAWVCVWVIRYQGPGDYGFTLKIWLLKSRLLKLEVGYV